MDFTDPQTLHFSVPIVSVVVLAALVFVCGFRASFEPPSFKALDEDNRKKNRRKNKRITNGFLLSDKVRASDSEEDRPPQPSKTPSWEQQPKVQDTPDQEDCGRKEEGNELEEDGKWITQPTKEDRKLQKERRRQQTSNRDLGSPRQLHTRWRDSSFDREASGKVRGKREGQDRDDWGWEVKSNVSAPAGFASTAKPRDAIRTLTREDKPRATTINHISIAPWAQKTPTVSVTVSTTTTTSTQLGVWASPPHRQHTPPQSAPTNAAKPCGKDRKTYENKATGTDDLDSGIDFSVMTFRDEDLGGTEVQVKAPTDQKKKKENSSTQADLQSKNTHCQITLNSPTKKHTPVNDADDRNLQKPARMNLSIHGFSSDISDSESANSHSPVIEKQDVEGSEKKEVECVKSGECSQGEEIEVESTGKLSAYSDPVSGSCWRKNHRRPFRTNHEKVQAWRNRSRRYLAVQPPRENGFHHDGDAASTESDSSQRSRKSNRSVHSNASSNGGDRRGRYRKRRNNYHARWNGNVDTWVGDGGWFPVEPPWGMVPAPAPVWTDHSNMMPDWQRMEYGWLEPPQRGREGRGGWVENGRNCPGSHSASAQATQGTQVPNHNEWKDIQLDHALLEDWRRRLEKQKDCKKSEASETESQTTEKTVIENGDLHSSEHDSSTEKVLTSSTESQTSSDEFQAQTEPRPTKTRSTECQTSEIGSKECETHSVECQVGGSEADEKTEENLKEAVPEKKEPRRKVKNSKKSSSANSSKSQTREASKEAPDVSIQSEKEEKPKELLPDKEILHIEDQIGTQTQDNEENSGKAKEDVEETSDNDDTWTVVLKTRGKRVKHIHVVSAAKTNKIVEAETRNEADGGEMLHGTSTNSISTPSKGDHETKVQAVKSPEPKSESSTQGTKPEKQVPKVKTFAMVAAGICTERNTDPPPQPQPPPPPPPPPPTPKPAPMETPSKKPETKTEKVVKKTENKLEPLTLGGSGPMSWADEMEMEESLQTKSPAASPTSTSPPPTTPWGTNAWPQRAPDVTSIETSVMAQQKTKLRTGKGANFLAIDISPDGNWVEDKPVKKKRKPRRDENFAVKTAA
ncbi:uncharacterized protein [Branchiostoma lanceolatum]|uniref:uncharacterized protein isoform X1 n=1 Tax=Branchiostoma lanceolatum TaxID=7740 RepID=UPI003451E546